MKFKNFLGLKSLNKGTVASRNMLDIMKNNYTVDENFILMFWCLNTVKLFQSIFHTLYFIEI